MDFFNKVGSRLHLNDDEYYDDYEDYEYANEEETYDDEGSVASIHSVETDFARIVTVWVSSYSDVKGFATEFRSGVPVILNLSDAGDADRTRIVDFAVGLCYGLYGDFSKISEDVFLLTPSSVQIESRGAENGREFGAIR